VLLRREHFGLEQRVLPWWLMCEQVLLQNDSNRGLIWEQKHHDSGKYQRRLLAEWLVLWVLVFSFILTMPAKSSGR